MPLPNLKNQCTATCRATKEPCNNPAAYGMATCRMHGAHKPETVKRGADHGRYRSGEWTQASKAAHRATMLRLALLEKLGFKVGMMIGKRTPGRKVKGGLIPENSLPAIAELETLLALTPEPSQTASKEHGR